MSIFKLKNDGSAGEAIQVLPQDTKLLETLHLLVKTQAQLIELVRIASSPCVLVNKEVISE